MPALRPFVLIGAGGSGGKTLRVVRETLRQRLIEVDWHGPWPEAWQLLHIDVPASPDGVSEDLPFELGASEYLNLAVRNSTYHAVDGTVARPGGEPSRRQLGIDSWRPLDPADVARLIDITLGAGQYRGVGRMALLSRLSDASKRINQAIDDARAAQPDVLLDLSRRLIGEQDLIAADSRPFVIVTGSLAGGSGSGTLLDICDLIRASSGTTGVKEIIAVLYTPELFQAEDGGYEPGVAPNTFMAINELFNSMTTAGPENMPVGRSFLYGRAGLNTNVHGGLGPTAAVLVGRQNAAISLGGATEIYHVMGRAIANLFGDPQVQGDLVSYSLGNSAQKTLGGPNHNPLVTADTVHTGDFKAMGFARLSVGREYFGRYSAERLARAAVERLLYHHLTLATRVQSLSDEELLTQLVDQAWPAFLRDSRCSELGFGRDGRPNNDIVEALWPSTADGLFQSWAARATTATLNWMAGRNKPPVEVRRTVGDLLMKEQSDSGTTSTRQFRDAMHATSREWVRDMHPHVQSLAVNTMVSYGLPAAARLLERLASQLHDARIQLEAEAAATRQQVATATATFGTGSPTDPNSIHARPDAVKPFIDAATQILVAHNRAVELKFAAEAADEIREGLILPWARAVRDIDGMLRIQARPAYGNSEVDFWPGPVGVPDHLRPSRSEFLLDDADAFPADFVQLVSSCIVGDLPTDEAIDAAVVDIARGDPDPQFPELPALTSYTRSWTPRNEYMKPGGQLASPASPRIELTLDLLFRRAMAWLKDSQKPSGRYLRQTLADYLEDASAAPAERVRRGDRFKGQFAAALRASAPLASIDSSMVTALHGEQQVKSDLTMSALNVPDSNPELRQSLRDIAVAEGLPKDAVTFTTTPRPDAQMVQVTRRGYHPMVYASLMGPLVDQWARARHDVKVRTDFWRWRRTRALGETVPLDPATRATILRGWYVGRMVGKARVAQADSGEYRIEIRTGSSWRALPAHGPRPTSPVNAPANVLELVAVGIMEAYTERSLSPLDPWRTLIELGADTSPALVRWIRTGDGLDPQGSPLIEEALPTAQERAQYLLDLIEQMHRTVEDDASPVGDEKERQSRVIMEALPEISWALDAIRADVESLAQAGTRDQSGARR